MKVSKNCISLVKKFEGCRLKAYKDSVGVWTVGYGCTSAEKDITGITVSAGTTITQAQADEWLEKSLNKKYSGKIMQYDDKYHWTQNEFDALVSFAYNIGSISQLTANGTRTKKEIASSMLLYTKAGGRTLDGLVKRRKAEHDLFISKDNSDNLKDSDDNEKKSIKKIAKEVIDGKWGNGETRRRRLEQAGYDYDKVQKAVNELL